MTRIGDEAALQAGWLQWQCLYSRNVLPYTHSTVLQSVQYSMIQDMNNHVSQSIEGLLHVYQQMTDDTPSISGNPEQVFSTVYKRVLYIQYSTASNSPAG